MASVVPFWNLSIPNLPCPWGLTSRALWLDAGCFRALALLAALQEVEVSAVLTGTAASESMYQSRYATQKGKKSRLLNSLEHKPSLPQHILHYSLSLLFYMKEQCDTIPTYHLFGF